MYFLLCALTTAFCVAGFYDACQLSGTSSKLFLLLFALWLGIVAIATGISYNSWLYAGHFLATVDLSRVCDVNILVVYAISQTELVLLGTGLAIP